MNTMKNKNGGFLLAEVLVALVILAIGLTISIQALIHTIRTNNLAYKKTTAILLADGHLSQMLMPQEGIPQSGSGGKLDDNFNWEINIEEVTPGLEKITYIVWWKEKDTTSRVELITYHAKTGGKPR